MTTERDAARIMLAALLALNARWDRYDEQDAPALGEQMREAIAAGEALHLEREE